MIPGTSDKIRALEKVRFTVVRVAGSHHRLVHQSDPTRATTVPVHKGRDLPRPFLRAILKRARLTLLNSLIFFDGACPAHLLLANFGSISRQFREIPCFGRITA